MSYQRSQIDPSNLLSFVTFSCWDHTAGPVVKCVWTPVGEKEPLAERVTCLAQLILKQEAKRDPKCPIIDSSLHFLPSYDVVIHSTLFSGRCKGRPGQRVYCLMLGVRLDKQDLLATHAPVVEAFLHHHILIYKATLHKDFELRSTDLSNAYLHNKLNDLVKILSFMEQMSMTHNMLIDQTCDVISDTYFAMETDKKLADQLPLVIRSMALTSNRIIVIGNSEYKKAMMKWVWTLSLLLSDAEKELCFIPPEETGAKFTLLPGATIQCHYVKRKDLDLPENVEQLLMSDHYYTILEVKSDRRVNVKPTAPNTTDHRDFRKQLYRDKIRNIIGKDNKKYSGTVSEIRRKISECQVRQPTSDVVSQLCWHLKEMNNVARYEYLQTYNNYLTSCVQSVIQFHLHSSYERNIENLLKNQLLPDSSAAADNLRLFLSLAEIYHPGISSSYDVDTEVLRKELEDITL